MYKFIHDEPYDKFSVTVSVDHINIIDILESFKDFLRGCSFSSALVDNIKYVEDDDCTCDKECFGCNGPKLDPQATEYIRSIFACRDDGK